MNIKPSTQPLGFGTLSAKSADLKQKAILKGAEHYSFIHKNYQEGTGKYRVFANAKLLNSGQYW